MRATRRACNSLLWRFSPWESPPFLRVSLNVHLGIVEIGLGELSWFCQSCLRWYLSVWALSIVLVWDSHADAIGTALDDARPGKIWRDMLCIRTVYRLADFLIAASGYPKKDASTVPR